MRKRGDRLLKTILAQALEPFGRTVIEQEVASVDAQYIDLWYMPGVPPRVVPAYLRLVARMAARASLLEPSSTTIEVDTIRGNLRKQLNWHHQLCLPARRRGAATPEPPHQKSARPPLPFLWTISPGRPDAVLRTFGGVAMSALSKDDGWPRGFYHIGQGLELGLVVISELPTGQTGPMGIETLVLRLLGTQRVREAAVAELADLARLGLAPGELAELRAFVISLRQIVGRDKKIGSKEREAFMTTVQAEFQKLEQDLIQKGIGKGRKLGRDEGREEGREEGLRGAIAQVCQAQDIPLTPARKRQLGAMKMDALNELLVQLLKQHRWPSRRR